MYRRESSSRHLLLQLTGILAAILAGHVHVNAQTGSDGFATCASNIYRCFSSTLLLSSSQLQPALCSSNDSCVVTAAATCPAAYALAGQELARAAYDLYRASCDQKYCFDPLEICVGNPFLTGYTNNNFGPYCRSYSTAAESCRTPDCANLDAVTSWKADLASLCVSGGECYQAAVTCISYAYFDPRVQDLNIICMNVSSASSCITNILSSASCTGASASITTAVNNLLQGYLTKCADDHVCNQTLESCLSAVVSTDISSNHFASLVCSNLASIQTCLSAYTACQARFATFIAQMQQYCAPQLCAAGVQYCYNSVAFNASLLQTWTVSAYLQSWCTAASTIQTCLSNHNTLCNVIGYDFQATVGVSLNSLCTLGQSANAADATCYWNAINCLYANGVVQYGTPTAFWVPSSTDYCQAVSYNATSSCLSTARSQCSGASAATYQQTIDSVIFAFTTSCTPACSTTGKQVCQDALTYYLTQMLNGSTNLCSLLSQPHTCYGMQIKDCTTLTSAVQASNVAILNSLFVSLSQICSSLTPPNGTNTCLSGVVQCLVTFFGGITGNTNFNTQSDICQNWTTTTTCIAAAQSTCTGSITVAISSIIQAVNTVLSSLKPCNPATTCDLQTSLTCQATLTSEIEIASGYSFPVDYLGNPRDVFCRKDLDGSAAISSGFQGDDDDLSPSLVCSYPKFYWGALCVNINATLECVGQATLNCSGAIQLSQQASLQQSAAAYISSCSGIYLCQYDTAVTAVQDLVKFGLQSQFRNVRNQKDNFCYWLSEISLSIWNSGSQCTPFVSQYFWQFVEAYLEVVTVNCKPRQIICSRGCPPPRTSWTTPLPPDCSMASIQDAFMSFFEVIWTESISVTPDVNVIASSLVTLQTTLQIIQTADVNYARGSCQWVADFTSVIIVNFQTTIDIIVSPPTCFISDAFDCVAGLQKFITKKGLTGAGNLNGKKRDLFCRAATRTFTCIASATASCTASQQQVVYDDYYALQDLVGYICRDRCTSDPCQNDGLCSTAVSTGTVTPPASCQCSPGYSGKNCEISSCSYPDLLACINPVINILLSGDISGLSSALTNAITCLNNLDDDCQYDFSFEITLEIIIKLNSTLTVTTSGCSASAVNTCLRPPNLRLPPKLFDPKTKFLSSDVCSQWSAVLSCLQAAGCTVTQIDSVSTYFAAGCAAPPPSTCPVRDVAEKVNRCGRKFNKVKNAKPRPKKKVKNPKKELGRCRKEYKPENEPPENENQLDDNGLNLNLDVCGEVGDSWSDANKTVSQCAKSWSDMVNGFLTSQAARFTGNGQCDSPCDTAKCAYGSTCVPNVNPPVGYTCACLPGWSGQYCDVAPTPTCQTKDCPKKFLDIVSQVVNGSLSPALCGQLSAVSQCLSTDLYPCGDNYAADATLMIQFISFVSSTLCVTPPPETCEVQFLAGCLETLITNVYENVEVDDNQCIYRQASAYCLTLYQVKCSGNGFVDILFDLSTAAVSQYVTSCEPSDCNVDAVINCLTPLQQAAAFQLLPSGSDTCSVAATAASCVKQVSSNCPPWLTTQINSLLSSLLSAANSGQPAPSVPGGSGDICATNPCQNGGTCSIDPSSPYKFTCACVEGFKGDFCHYLGCSQSNVSLCVALLLPVFNVPWENGCPTVDCSLLSAAFACLSAVTRSCPTRTNQVGQLANMINVVQQQLCNAPAACGPQPATCPTSQIRECLLQSINVAFIINVSDQELALEVGMPFRSLGGDASSVACVNKYVDTANPACTNDFENALGSLLTAVNPSYLIGSCNIKSLETYKTYIPATVTTMKAQPNLPYVVQQALCTNMHDLLVAADTSITSCEISGDDSFTADAITERGNYNTNYQLYESVCALQGCTPNPCQNGGVCVPQPGGGFTCSCPRGISGDTCENGQPSCTYNKALACFQTIRTIVDSCIGISNNNTLCQAISQTRDCIAATTVNCDDELIVKLNTELNVIQSKLSLSCYSPCDTKVCGYTSGCTVGPTAGTYTCSCAFGFKGPDCLTDACDYSAVTQCTVNAFGQVMDGTFCPNGLATAVSCINAYTDCSVAYRSTAITIVTDFDTTLCRAPNCSLATVKAQCLSLFPTDAAIWDAVKESFGASYCSASIVSKVFECLANLRTCEVSASFSAIVKYVCPKDPLPLISSNCSLTVITDELTTLQSSLDQAKKKSQQPSSSSSTSSSSSNSCNDPPPARSVTVNYYKSGMLCIDGTVQTLQNANSWTKSDTVTLPESPKVIGIRGSRTPCKKAGMIAAATNDYFVTDSKWKCSACSETATDFCAVDFDDKLWSPAVVLKPFIGSGRQIDGLDPSTSANFIWTDTTTSIDKTVCCRLKAITPLVLSLYSECDYRVYIDGTLQQNPAVPDSTATFTIPSTASLISVELGENCCCGFIASATGDAILSDNTWKCSEQLPTGWTSTPQSDWPSAVADTANDDPTDSHGVSLNAKWTSTGTGTVNRFGCQKQFTQPAAYPVQTTNKQCDSQPAVPDDGSNPCWYVQLSYSSVQSIIGGCSSSLDAQYSSLVTSLLANYSVSSTCSNQCADNPCLNQATCVPSQFSFKCQCQPGYSGALCEKGGQCSLQSTQDCLTRLTVLSKAIVDNATLLLLPDTITQLQSILLCLSVNQQPCGPQDSYVYRVIVVYINYLIEQSVSVVPTVSCDYKAFISCTLRLTSDIYLSSTGLSVSLQTMLQCLTTISSSCGQVSLPIDEVIWLTWQTINIVFPDPTCSLSVALACTEDISVAFANDPTSSSAVCLYYSDTITCINNAVASCPGSAISDRIVATVLDSIQAVSVLCINACDGYPCFHGGVCTQVGATPYCTCPSGWAGSRCEQPSGCQLDALSACLEEGFALIALALTDPCSPIDCSSPTGVVGRLRVCLETNVLQCDHAIIVQINQLKAALALLVTLPGVCAASPPPNCVPVIPPIQCDWQTVTAQIVTMVQTAFSQLSAFPGPDLNLLCTVTNQTKVIITNRECQVPGLQTILQGVETWISTVINTTCSPVCPASGSLPQASSCLAQLKQLVDSVLNATVLSLTAQNSFCGDVWLSGSCVQSSVDFCSDLTIQTEYAEYTASVSVICPLPCQFDVCQPGSICVPDPNSPFGFLCQCPPGSIDVNCQIQPSCDISEVAQCIQPVQDLMTTGGGSLSLPRTTFCDALKEATDCLNALRLNCTDTVFDPVFNKFYKTLDAFQRSLQFVCTKPCDSSPCYNDATCVDNDSSNSFSCVCPPKFSGPTCQEQLCSEADINACFDDVLIAFFTSPGESLCQVIAAVHTCLVTTTATCSDSISSVYFSIEANLTAYLSVACSFTPPKYLGCPLLALSSCPSADLIALLDGSTDGLTALQLTTVCSDFNAFVECASAISSDCTSVALAVGSVLSTVCTVPPDPQCSVKVAINALFEFASYALTAQQSWSRGDRYGGETRDRYWSRKNKTAKVDHWIPRPIDYVFTDGPIYACWHLDTLKVTITTSISSCLIASIVENITATLTAYEVQFLSDGACSYPCDGDPCVAGGVCSVVGLGFDCQCAPGYSGDYCDIGANCNYQAAYTDWNIFDALLNGGVISLGQFLNAGGGDAWSTLQQTFYVSLLPCPDDGNQSTAIEILITIISEIITQTIDCDVDGAFQCAASFLVAMQPPLGSNSPPDASQLCLLLQTLYDCALNVRISCSLPAIDFRQPPEVLPISTQLAQQAFIASQAVCDITLCQVSVAKQCLLTLYDIIATNGPDLCTLVFTQKECISVAIASCPAFVAVDIQASVTSALSGVPCLSPCSTEPCLNGGTCIEMSPTTYDCQCTSQFTGDRCQTNVGCDVSSVETCVGASLQQIVYAFLDPCNNAIACSLIDDLVLCLRSKTVLCDNATQGYFESAIGAFLSIRFVCDVRTAPTGCDSNDCSQSYQSLRALILGFLSNFFDQLTQPQGPNFHLVCSSWESIKSQLITICPVGSFRSTVSRSLSWIQNVTSSVCTVPICSAPSALGCLSYLNTYLAQVQARPDVLPSDLNDFCSVAQSSYDCVIGNLAQCSADDPTRISILSQWNMTFTTILSSGLCTLPCVVNPCLNDGTCVQISATNFTCSCDSRHAGQLCQYAALYPYDNSTGLTCQTNVYNPSLSFNIILSLPIQLFCQSFSNIFVSQSGYVTLDSNTPILSFLQFCPSARSILAPLFAWQDCSCAGSAVYYNHYSTDTLTSSDSLGANIIGRATEQVRQYSSDATFSATTVVVVTWNNVFPYPCNYYKTQYGLTTGSTYQLVIIADLLTTYAVYNYDSLNINVLVPAVYTGQNVNGQCTIGWNPKSISSPDILSVTPPVTNLPGQWFYQLFNSSATCPPPPPQLQCLAYVRKTIDLTQYSLQACPCNGRLAASDPRFRFTYIDWFRYCFSYNIPSQAASGLSFTQTCCYSPTNSALFTNPPYAGFPTVSGGSVSDTQIYAACCINSNTYCNLFLALRPIDKCNTYTGPAQALIWGDPHFYTVDGLAFTFNGIGDYVMTKTRTSSYVFQARTAQFSDTTGRLFNASGFVAFAAQEFASKIEVYMNAARNGLVVYYNGLQYSQNSLIVPSIYIAQTATAVNVTFPSGWTLNIGLAFRFLSVVQTLPLVAWNNTQGLLGLYNGVASDDLMAPDGTVLPPTATLRSIHYNLGLLWQVQASDSLFTSNVARVTANPDFLPVFDSPCATAADDTAAKSLCGSSLNCYYDYCVTLNSEIASSTLAAETSYNMSRQILASLAPTLSIVELQSYFNLTGQWLLNATVNRPLTLTLRAVSTVSGVTVAVQMVGTVASQATANLNPTTGVFTWTPTSLDPVDVSFVAIDSNGGVSPELQVTVRLCGGCSGHGTCDYTRYQYVGTGVNFQLTSCTCDVGWNNNTGGECASPFNACVLNPCGVGSGAVCTPYTPEQQQTTQQAFSCASCLPGYALPLCIDINECAQTSPQVCNQICNNTQGSYTCSCRSGYVLENQTTCKDIDECSLRTFAALCGQICVNTPGSYQCACQAGYRLASDGINCEDINECTERTALCNQGCNNLPGSYECTCSPNYRLVGPYRCVALPLEATIRFRFSVPWDPSYLDQRSTAFIRLKNTIEPALLKIIRGAVSVLLTRCFQSSVGADVVVGFNDTVTPAVASNISASIGANLGSSGYSLVAPDGTVFPVLSSPEVIVNNATVDTSYNPCTDYKLCQNGGVCQSPSVNGVYAAPTCSCNGSYTGQYCEQNTAQASTTTTPQPTTSVNIMSVVLGVSIPLAIFLLAVLGLLIYKGVVQPRQAKNYWSDLSSPRESLGLEGKRSLRMHRFWPLKPRST